MFDKDGVLSSERTDLSSFAAQKYSKGRVGITFGRGFKRADVFLGLSAGNILTLRCCGLMIYCFFCNGKS
jgi:hypothetical protein